MAQLISLRINDDLPGYLPRLKVNLDEIEEKFERNFQQGEKLNRYIEKVEKAQFMGITQEAFDNVKFKVINMKNELDFFKKHFSKEKIEIIEGNEVKLIEALEELQEIYPKLDKKAFQKDLEKTQDRFKNYATRTDVAEIQERMLSFATKDETERILKSISMLEKRQTELCPLALFEETTVRNRSEFQAKIDNLHTKGQQTFYEQQVTAEFDRYEKKFTEEMEAIRSDRSGAENDIQKIFHQLKCIDQELDRKLGGKDYQYIMEYFKRFAEYSVFRDLYNKTVPIVQKMQEALRQH